MTASPFVEEPVRQRREAVLGIVYPDYVDLPRLIQTREGEKARRVA